MVLHFLPFSFSCYVHFFTQDVNTHCVKIWCLNLCSQDVIQTKSPIPEPPLYLLEQKQKQKQVYGLTEETATSDVWMKEELRSALKHYEIDKNETAKPTYGLTDGPMNG